MEAIRAQWEAEQQRLKQKLITTSQYDEIRYVGGVDISFVKESRTDACVCLVVLDYHDLDRVVYQKNQMIKLTQPYIAGFLAFRECDPIVQVLDELRATHPELVPQVILVDGNGVLHPRGFGSACHFGVVCDIPTIGVAKNFLWFEDLDAYDRHKIRDLAKEQLTEGGSYFPLQGHSQTIHGVCLRAVDASSNPIYVSVGHRVSLEDAISICVHCSRFRIPEPVRQADLISREFLRALA